MRKISARFRRYGFAVLVLLLGMVVGTIPVVREGGTPIIVLFFLVLLSAWYGGLGPGLLTTALIVLLTWSTPSQSWQVVRLALFIAGGAFISALAEMLHAARRRIEASQERLTAVLTSIGDAVIATDARGRVTFINPVAQKLTGWGSEEAVGRPLTEIFRIVNEDTRAAVEHPVDRVLRDGIVVGLANHTVLIARDGTERPIDDSAAPVKEKGGAITGAVLVFRDVTQHRQAEAVKARLAAIVESSDDAIIGKNLDGVVTSWNPAATRLFGHAAEEIVGRSIGLLIPPDLQDEESAILEWIRRGETVGHYEADRLTKDQRRIDVSLSISPIRNGSGQIIGASKIARDITERRRAEEALRQQARLLDQAFDPILVWQLGGVITFWNEGACKLYGFTAAEALGQVSHELLQTVFPAGITAFEAALREHGRWDGELRHQTKDQRWVTVDSRQLLVLEAGRPVQVLEANRDITERRRAEEQLRNSERMLRQSQRMAHVGSWELELNHPSDLHRGALRWSDECFRIFGYEPGQVAVTNDLFLQAVHPDDRDSVTAAVAQALRDNGPYAIEHRIARPDGTERVIFEWGEIIADSTGHPIRFLGSCQDITERKRAEEKLRYQMRLNRAITERAGESIFVTDQQGRVLFMNEEAERVFGFSFEELVGSVLHDAIHHHYPDGRTFPWAECPSARVCLTGEVVRNHEDVFFRKDGSALDAVCASAPIELDGRQIGVVFILHDVTERKRAELALRLYANRLENLREIDLAILSSRSPREIAEAALGHLTRLMSYWTGGVVVYDFEREEIEVIASVGLLREWHPPGTRFHNDLTDRPEFGALRQGRVATAEDVREIDLTSPLMQALETAGMRSYVLVPLRDRGRLFGSLLLVSDIQAAFSADHLEMAREVADHLAVAIRHALLLDEVQTAKERLEALSRQLIRAQEEERRRIARDLHDEVGQSLTASKIALDRLARDPSGPDIGRRLADAGAMTALALEQVRDLSRLLRPALLDDLGLAESLRALVEGLAERTGLEAEVEVDEVRPVNPEVEMTCYRIAQEALTNAVKHAGGTRLRVALHRVGDDLELVVEDDGTGFDVAAATTRAARGSSLGVLGLQERAMLAGGRTQIGSRPGGGTRVHTLVPAGRRQAGPDQRVEDR
jgi:PAS domain S-box-containing protein